MEKEKRVNLFTTCLANSLFPNAAIAVVKTLNRAGFYVDYPQDQTCCGQMAFNAGFTNEARELAEFNIRLWEKIEGDIILPSGSCTAMIRKHYPSLFEPGSKQYQNAKDLAGRVFEFSEFLVDKAEVVDFGAALEAKVAYHPSCHLLRSLGVDKQPKELIQNVQGLELINLAPECCGFGGVFAEDHAVISTEMLKKKIDAIERSEAKFVTGADLSCLMHIQGGLLKVGSKIKCVHIAEILAGGLE